MMTTSIVLFTPPLIRGLWPAAPSRRTDRATRARVQIQRAAAAAAAPLTTAQVRALTQPNNPVQIQLRKALLLETLRALQAQARANRVQLVSMALAMQTYPGDAYANPANWIQRLINGNRRLAWQANRQALTIQAAGITPASPVDALRQAEESPELGNLGSALVEVCRQVGAQAFDSGYFMPDDNGGGGGGGGGGGPLNMNAPANSAASGAVFDSDASGLGYNPSDYVSAQAADYTGTTPFTATAIPPTAPGAGEGGGDTGDLDTGPYLDFGDFDSEDLGSWLSKAAGKIGIKKIIGPAAATGSAFIPVIGPILSAGITAVSAAVGAREERKAIEAQARASAAAAQAQAQAAAAQAQAGQIVPGAPAPVIVQQQAPKTPRKRGGGKDNSALLWILGGGAVLLALGNRR